MAHIFTAQEAKDLQETCRRSALNAGKAPEMKNKGDTVTLKFQSWEIPCTIVVISDEKGFFLAAYFRPGATTAKNELFPVELCPDDRRGWGLDAWNFCAAYSSARKFLQECVAAERIAACPPLPTCWTFDGWAYQLENHPEISEGDGCEVTWEDDNPVFFITTYDDIGDEVYCDWKDEFMAEDTICEFLSPEAEAKNLYECLEEITQWMIRQYPAKRAPAAC